MAVNLDRPDNWKADIAKSVDMFNDWFIHFAPKAFRASRSQAVQDVEAALKATSNMKSLDSSLLHAHPEALPTLRMSTCPPLAVDRLIGLSGARPSLVRTMEDTGSLPKKLTGAALDVELGKIAQVIVEMVDPDLFDWLSTGVTPGQDEVHRAATVVADRLCGSVANPIIRNAQEKRQFAVIEAWLRARGYNPLESGAGIKFDTMSPGTFAFRMNVPVKRENGDQVMIPIDIAIMPKVAAPGSLPVMIEAKSAGDFTNVNKRRKEEAAKMAQLRYTYGSDVRFNLFLCGYFDCGYLGYEAAEGIDWVWEHRIDDLAGFGL